mmetsp:Transcript_4134/g.6160  ORF Transcript_4134/g.6160 Transcript_4134/m.6160 type:complete len:213 (+) Transcript_4134:56-694(+)
MYIISLSLLLLSKSLLLHELKHYCILTRRLPPSMETPKMLLLSFFFRLRLQSYSNSCKRVGLFAKCSFTSALNVLKMYPRYCIKFLSSGDFDASNTVFKLQRMGRTTSIICPREILESNIFTRWSAFDPFVLATSSSWSSSAPTRPTLISGDVRISKVSVKTLVADSIRLLTSLDEGGSLQAAARSPLVSSAPPRTSFTNLTVTSSFCSSDM